MQREFPQEVIDDLIDWVGVGSVGRRDSDLRACSLVAWSWVERSRHHLFHSIELASTSDIGRWVENIRPGVGGVSGYVKKLWIHFGWDEWSQRFQSVEHLKSFTRVQDLNLTYWYGGQTEGEEVEEVFGGIGQSVRSLSFSMPRGNLGSFLHLLSVFPRLDNLSILTSHLDEASEPLPRNVVTVRGNLVLDSVEEHFVKALAGCGLRPKVLKVSIPNLTSFDELLAACAPGVETISLSPTYGACLDHTSLANFTTLRHVEIKLVHPKLFLADVHTVLRPIPSPHLERVTFNFSKAILRKDLEEPETAEGWVSADEVLHDLSTRRPHCRLLLVIKGNFDSDSPIEDLVGTMSNILPRFMDVGVVETEGSADAPLPEHEI